MLMTDPDSITTFEELEDQFQDCLKLLRAKADNQVPEHLTVQAILKVNDATIMEGDTPVRVWDYVLAGDSMFRISPSALEWYKEGLLSYLDGYAPTQQLTDWQEPNEG